MIFTNNFTLLVNQTLSGLDFVLSVSPNVDNGVASNVLKRIYSLYIDWFVMNLCHVSENKEKFRRKVLENLSQIN